MTAFDAGSSILASLHQSSEQGSMTALTTEELIAWVERTTSKWRGLVAQHPEVLTMPCEVRETKNVAELVQHIVAVELR